jgi:hypothetical protein
MFFSSEVAHEVRPTYHERHALTIWYYDTEERKRTVDAALKEGSASMMAAKTSVEAQREAKDFIGVLMGGDEVSGDGGEPTEFELRDLALRVTNLSNEALQMVASITGAPSTESFKLGFPQLTVTDLKSMRALFRRMGLGNYTTV